MELPPYFQNLYTVLGDGCQTQAFGKGLWQIIKTEQSILEIALDFITIQLFLGLFKNQMGCPKEFREQYKKNKELLLTKLHKNKPKFEGFEERKETPVLFLQKRGAIMNQLQKHWVLCLTY